MNHLLDDFDILDQISLLVFPLISIKFNLDMIGKGENIFA